MTQAYLLQSKTFANLLVLDLGLSLNRQCAEITIEKFAENGLIESPNLDRYRLQQVHWQYRQQTLGLLN